MAVRNDHSDNQRLSIRLLLVVLLALAAPFTRPPGWGQLVPGSMDVHWSEGSPNCANNPQPPLQVHQYNPQTFIIRENLCTTFEAPFIYLLIGSAKALLIDTGDVIACRPEDTLDRTWAAMRARGLRHLPVLDAEGGLVGVLSARDVLLCLNEAAALEQDSLKEYFLNVGYR